MSLSLVMGGQVITNEVTNIQTKNLMTGGYASVTFNVKRQLDRALFDTFTDVFTYDPATGEQTGGGRLLTQGREDDGTWKVECLGEGLASLQDVTTPRFYVDQTISYWFRNSRSTQRLDVNIGNYPVQADDDQTIVCTVTEGVVLAINSQISMTNKLPNLTHQRIGSFGYRDKAGITNSNFKIRGYVLSEDRTTVQLVIDDIWDTTISGRQVAVVGTDFTDRYDMVIAFSRVTTVSPTTNEDYWATVRDITLQAQLYGRDGTLMDQTDRDYTNENVKAHEVLTDWVAELCPRLNAATGTIATTTEPILQMAYPEGIHGMQLADDCAVIEPGFVWQVWEQGTDGRWPFNYVPISTGVQYEASTADGFTAPSPTNEIYDEVVVTGKTPAGRDINLLVTSTVPVLVAAGIPRRATIPLGAEIWSATLAASVGAEFLASHSFAPGAGTITIARPIFDAVANRWIGPQHIRAGGLIRVRGIQPTTSPLNTTAADGVTVFRIVSATYDNDSNSTVCELDAYTLTESRRVTEAAKAAPTPRGKHK